MEFEKPLTIGKLSMAVGGVISAASIRAACHRAPDAHPLPHVKNGEKRPVILIRPSVFEQWYREEEAFEVGALDRGAGIGST